MSSTTANGSNSLSVVLSRALMHESGLTITDWPHVPIDAQTDFITAVTRHRVSSTIAPVGKLIGLTPGSQDQLDSMLSHDILGSMRLQSVAAAITDVLTRAGVRSLAYKGVALAAQTTGDPASRGFGDVDILVSPSDFIAAHNALIGAGARLMPGYVPDPHSHLWPTAQRIGNEAPYRWRGVDLDMHWRFDRLPQIANIEFDALWGRRAYVTLAGQQVATLGELDALMVTCVHGTKEQWRQWRWVVDAVRQMRVVPEEDWNAVREYSRATGCEEGLAVAVALANKMVPGSSPFAAGTRANRLADHAWNQAVNDNSPFGDISREKQTERLQWMLQTLPSVSSAGSVAVRLGWANLDLAEVPLPRYLMWAYPLMRPYLWNRRLRSGSYGGHATTK
ncbi:MAG: nucleotidyltransferase family protein [Candidatus Nanopelagicales bacterium]